MPRRDHRQIVSDVAEENGWCYQPGLGCWDYSFTRHDLTLHVRFDRAGVIRNANLHQDHVGVIEAVYPRLKLEQTVAFLRSPAGACSRRIGRVVSR